MSKKKKIASDIKEKRRLHEAEKANMKSRFGFVFTPTATAATVPTVSKKETTVDERFSLPVATIKRDMLKNGMYMVFVFIVLIVLKITGATF